MYSQNNEEEIIQRYFDGTTGTFLDLGANDGITLSNTMALSLNGWSGCLVEASPKAIARLEILYEKNTKCDIVNAAIGSYNGEIILHESGEHLGKGDVALLSSVKDSELERWKTETFTPVTVPCINFATLLGLTRYNKFDFISIDIEGMELDVLPQMDLKALGCWLLCVEFNGKEQEKYDAIILPQGYKLIHKNAENLIYSKNRDENNKPV